MNCKRYFKSQLWQINHNFKIDKQPMHEKNVILEEMIFEQVQIFKIKFSNFSKKEYLEFMHLGFYCYSYCENLDLICWLSHLLILFTWMDDNAEKDLKCNMNYISDSIFTNY